MRASILLLALVACERPSPRVICHNANCIAPSAERDDSLPVLDESLALTYGGLPLVDGVELDTFWFGAESRCLFAHDLDHDTSTSAVVAAQHVADHLASTDRPAWNGERFYVLVELKANVADPYDSFHTPEQRALHAECALDVLDTVLAGARARGHMITVGFLSSAPALLRELVARPRWSAYDSAPDLERMLIGDIFAPYSSVVPELSDYEVPLDGMEFHPDFMTRTREETYRALGLELFQWSFVMTPEAFDSLERWEPAFVLTNEARLVRNWIER
ncbi:MAG: hypothetical protein HOV81_36395 [Kofleriaceae bacterium]|nr:hypothetical protein [Kofleriaceae bacterium]